MRYGIPMYQPRQRVHVFVTVEPHDGSVFIKHWTGENVKRIRKAVRERYPDATLSFGHAFWVTV